MFPIPPPSDRQLQFFGAALGSLFLVFAGLLRWKWQMPNAALALTVLAVALATLYYAIPKTRRPIYDGFRKLTYPIQLLMTVVVLAIVYYVLITPIGGLLRFRGVTVRRKCDPGHHSYWTPVEKTGDSSRYFDSF